MVSRSDSNLDPSSFSDSKFVEVALGEDYAMACLVLQVLGMKVGDFKENNTTTGGKRVCKF